MFEIHMGIPEMEEFWDALTEKVSSGKASKNEHKLYNLIGKAMVLLANDPRHPGLQSHEIEVLTECRQRRHDSFGYQRDFCSPNKKPMSGTSFLFRAFKAPGIRFRVLSIAPPETQ